MALTDVDADAEHVRFQGKADIPCRSPMSANDPKRTFSHQRAEYIELGSDSLTGLAGLYECRPSAW